MNEIQPKVKEESRNPIEQFPKGPMECIKRTIDEGGKLPEKINSAKVPKNQKSEEEMKSKGSSKILETLKKIKSVTSLVLIDNSKNIFSENGNFLADFFICYFCLVYEPVDSLIRHLDITGHKAKESLLRIKKKEVKLKICGSCNVMIIGFQNSIYQHFNTKFHKNFSKNNSNSEKSLYCMKKEYELIVKGLRMLPSCKREILNGIFKEFGKIKKMIVSEFRCVVYFEDSWSVKEKLSETPNINGIKLKLQWREIKGLKFITESNVIAELTNIDRLSKKLEELLEDHHKFVCERERERETSVCESLLNCVQMHYPESVCYIFGSRLTGLSFRDCDLDIYLDCDNFYYGMKKCQESKLDHILNMVAKCLRKSSDFSHITAIKKARVPIINVKHIETGICCDISFKNGLSVEKSALIKFMVNIDERIKPMLFFVKYWMKENNFYGRPHFSNYAITVLVLYYLSQYPNPVLPTVNDLRNQCKGPKKFIDGWNCTFLMDQKAIPKTKNEDSVPQLLFGFFSFYEKFDFSKNLISLLTGTPIFREDLKNFQKVGLPLPYRNLTNVQSLSSLWNEQDEICVMDPFDLGYNLTGNFPKMSVKHFSYSCGLSAHLLSETMLYRNYEFLN